MTLTRKQCLLATGTALALSATPAFAQESTRPSTSTEPSTSISPLVAALAPASGNADYIDLEGSLGWASNPLVRTANSQSSIFGRASVRGVHAWSNERSASAISGYLEGTTYFNEYDIRSIFSLNANHTQRISETATIYGSAGLNGDLSGQLSNRFFNVPPFVPDPGNPLPPTVDDPDLFSFNGRSYRIFGQGGVSIQTGERSGVGLSGGVTRAIFTNDLLDDYTTMFARGSYRLTLSERTNVGATLGLTRTQYDGSDDHSTIVNPAATLSTQLSETLSAQASVGVSFARVERGATETRSTNLSVNASLCRRAETESLCGRVLRNSHTSASSRLVTTNTIGVDWSKKLDATQSVQLSASAIRYVTEDVLNQNQNTTYFRLAASYSRMISQRMSGGVSIAGRSLHRKGTDSDTDISGTVFIRYRIGDLG